ncbi:MAG: ATP-grasp domain-containing protein [Candidatus Acidiferrum sp.]|jgi:predicted ATP-grasp superfamily ATP-dependent carboligase
MTSGFLSPDSPGAPKVGALVVGGDFHGLAIVRSLARKGIPVCVVDNEHSIARFSRYTTHYVKVEGLRNEQETVGTLLSIAKRMNLRGWVLYATRDEHVAAFARHRAALAEWFRVPTPDWEVVKWAWNKWNTYQLAQKIGLCIPTTYCPRSVEELETLDVQFPVGVKPAVKEDFFYATRAKAWRANNREELKVLFARALEHSRGNEVLIQEIIPGDGQHQYSSCLFFKEGRILASMEALRWRQHPPEFGRAATYVESIDHPEVREMSAHFLREINYYGLAEVEFKRDPRDGKLKLLDVNARTWGFHALGEAAGVDFSSLLFADQVGEPVKECHGDAGVGWMRVITDFPYSLIGLMNRQLPWSAYVQSLRNVAIESVYSSEDLKPSIAEFAMLPYLILKKGI